ncbi:unnamed protein product [Arabidopsis thaliana]|uniref:(thale cress) hypothetical protein n=1 Tax=Arabidopsis thaliana TaxID=3702 RepID=A0A7G2ELX4_ARATH|nr:unnamed protein product [Arabidopsis thaliana]
MEVTETREEEEIKETKFQYISTIKFPMVSINPIFVSSKLVLHPLPSRLHLLLTSLQFGTHDEHQELGARQSYEDDIQQNRGVQHNTYCTYHHMADCQHYQPA